MNLGEFKNIPSSQQLDEKVQPLPSGLSLEETLVELTKRMDGARRALSLANKLKDKAQFKKHFSAITANMNTIRAGLTRAMRQLDQFERAALARATDRSYAAVREESRNDRLKAVHDKFADEKQYWVVKNTETGKVVSVMTDEDRAWDLADRLMNVGRKHHHLVVVGSKADYDNWRQGKGD